MPRNEPWKIVRLLAFTQIVSWGSLYYAFSIVAPDIQRETGWRTELVFGAYSWSLLISGLISAPVGVLLDRYGGRYVMGSGSLLAAAGLALLATGHSVAAYIAGWTLIGIAMAMALYEAAFATINREFLLNARKGISVLTLFGGLASTVFWPLTLKLNGMLGWRDTFLVYAGIHLLLCAPLHAFIPAGERRKAAVLPDAPRDYTLHEALRDPVFWKLAFAFAANIFIFSVFSAHLIPMLQTFGHSAGTAVLAASLIGPMQVAGRLGEMALAHRVSPQNVGKLTFVFVPGALLALIFFGAHQTAIAGFCLLYGMSNGVLTIVRGTVPQAMFGRENYGAISGAMSGPSMLAKAAGPIAGAALIGFSSSPQLLLIFLFAVSVTSLTCFIAAVKAQRTPS